VNPLPGWEWEPNDNAWTPCKPWQDVVHYWKERPEIDNSQIYPNTVSLGGARVALEATNQEFFVRDCYTSLFDRVCSLKTKAPTGGVLVTGQSGIGTLTLPNDEMKNAQEHLR